MVRATCGAGNCKFEVRRKLKVRVPSLPMFSWKCNDPLNSIGQGSHCWLSWFELIMNFIWKHLRRWSWGQWYINVDVLGQWALDRFAIRPMVLNFVSHFMGNSGQQTRNCKLRRTLLTKFLNLVSLLRPI